MEVFQAQFAKRRLGCPYVFNRYKIVSPEDLKQASRKMETYIRSQMGTVQQLPKTRGVGHVG